jgi:chromosome segregation ATPase
MGREATVTFEQITALADAMKMEGVKPTSRAVRERLGNTGSMGTINKLLQRWKSGQERQVSAALVLPPALQRALLEFMDTELTRARTTLESELADQQQEAADLATENERQVLENDAQSEVIEALRAEVSKHQGRAGQLEADLVVARDEASRERSGAELARTELAKAQLRLEAMPRLEADLVAVRAVLDAERLARVAAEQSAAVMNAKLEASDRRAAEADERTSKMEAAAAQIAAKAEAVARELVAANAGSQAAQARQENAAREVEEAKKSAASAQAAAKQSGEEAAELRGQVEFLKKQTEAVSAITK